MVGLPSFMYPKAQITNGARYWRHGRNEMLSSDTR
jgi:hypothetical protein